MWWCLYQWWLYQCVSINASLSMTSLSLRLYQCVSAFLVLYSKKSGLLVSRKVNRKYSSHSFIIIIIVTICPSIRLVLQWVVQSSARFALSALCRCSASVSRCLATTLPSGQFINCVVIVWITPLILKWICVFIYYIHYYYYLKATIAWASRCAAWIERQCWLIWRWSWRRRRRRGRGRHHRGNDVWSGVIQRASSRRRCGQRSIRWRAGRVFILSSYTKENIYK